MALNTATTDPNATAAGLFWTLVMIGAFVPLIIAWIYKFPGKGKIAVLSLLLGWTIVGWIAALVIAIAGATAPPNQRR